MSDIVTPLQIVPHPKRGTNDIGTERIVPAWAEIRAAEGASDERPVLEIVTTDDSEDRHGSVINSDAWKTDGYMRHRVVLWQHGVVDEYPWVAKTLTMKRVGKAWRSDVELLVNLWRHMQSNVAAFLWEAYRDHGMGAMSRAFIPLKWKARKATQIPNEFAEDVEYTEVEMTEQSFVNIPSNRNALAVAVERARSAGRFNNDLARMLGYDVSAIPIITGAKESRMATRNVETFRSEIADTLKRCCGCDPYREPKPETITEEQKAADVATMTDVAKAQLTVLDAALTGWRSTANNNLRGMFSGVAVSAMYTIEGLIYRAKDWYGADLVIDLPAVESTELEAIVTAAAPEYSQRSITPAKRAVVSIDQRAAGRAKIAEILRCCGCGDPYHVEKPTLPTDEALRSIDIDALRELADIGMQEVETATRAWKESTTEPLRNLATQRVWDGMWLFDTCAKWLSEWYGEEVESLPAVDYAEVERALKGIIEGQRAGAVFSKKNLEKIDQLIEIANDLRAAANKPTAADLPSEERRTPAAVETRAEGPFEYASTQVTLEGDVAEKVLALAATIPDEVLDEKGRETTPHVTIKFGLDPAVTADQVREVLANSDSIRELLERGATLTLGKTAIFESEEGSHANGADVVYVEVDSDDLKLLNKTISEALPVSDTHPDYVPHITLAYVKKGEGQKYAGDETLAGTVVTFSAIQYSDTEGEMTEIELAAAVASRAAAKGFTIGVAVGEAARGAQTFRIKESGGATREQVAASQPIRLLAPDTARGRAADSPKNSDQSLYVTLLSD